MSTARAILSAAWMLSGALLLSHGAYEYNALLGLFCLGIGLILQTWEAIKRLLRFVFQPTDPS